MPNQKKIFKMTQQPSPEIWANIKLVIFDVDGVLTDGGLYISPTGEETRRFDIKDGAGIKELIRNGVKVAFVSSRAAPSAKIRGNEIGVRAIFDSVKDKAQCVKEIAEAEEVSLSEVAYMGDDITDIPVLGLMGVFAAPSDASPKIRAGADFVTNAPGGRGAAREFADRILSFRSA